MSNQSTAVSKSPLERLNNGVQMPALGLGTYLSPREQTADAVECAIATGYRLIDAAAGYGNEQQVGEGIARSGIARSDLFVTTKLWIADYGYEQALRGFDASLRRLGLEYLDLYLLHWPVPSDFAATVASYRAAERLLAEGRVRAIGVCNFTPDHLQDLVVVLRWHLQHGLAAIPKSVHAKRIAENIDVFDFELDETDMTAIDQLDTGRRAGADPDLFGGPPTAARVED